MLEKKERKNEKTEKKERKENCAAEGFVQLSDGWMGFTSRAPGLTNRSKDASRGVLGLVSSGSGFGPVAPPVAPSAVILRSSPPKLMVKTCEDSVLSRWTRKALRLPPFCQDYTEL